MLSNRIEAASKGHKHFDGVECKTCGGTQRYTSTGGCVACAKSANKRFLANVKAQLKQAKGGE